jgi:hypothetical protein
LLGLRAASIAVAESGRSAAVEHLGQVANDPGDISKLCDRLGGVLAGRWRFVMRQDRAVMAFIGNLKASAIGPT